MSAAALNSRSMAATEFAVDGRSLLGLSMASDGPPSVPVELQLKAEQKYEAVQQVIVNLEQAIRRDGEPDRRWLRGLLNPKEQCFRTLVALLVEPKYEVFVHLQCVALRAVQMLLRVAVNILPGGLADPNTGMRILRDLAGQKLATEAYHQVSRVAVGHVEPLLACNAMLVLAELGPEALEVSAASVVPRLLDLFVALPDRADELVEVALRMHAWGKEPRKLLLEQSVLHAGGRLLGEVLLQVINRGDAARVMRAVKVLSGCLSLPNGELLLYTNDAKILMEILLRELPNHAEDEAAFACHADCLRALSLRYQAARQHSRWNEVLQVLTDLRDDELVLGSVRTKCRETISALQGETEMENMELDVPSSAS
eukprot:CAMPEP_0170613228 /NCGR_PEP_ID=MMETSP0224-20130122/24159_1 /TAXON_ID=285029 /ORGANISM="Togula jolla, Strain CCCM 725" /LENGTH=369 /DNA_ID=CAMNT_0010938813 /DNA_START=41 /DNA_END=1152 /DNA_ORIENTATION=+